MFLNELRYARLERDKLRVALNKAVGWLEHDVPEKPDHDCGNPDSGCDMDCVDWVRFCGDMREIKEALKL